MTTLVTTPFLGLASSRKAEKPGVKMVKHCDAMSPAEKKDLSNENNKLTINTTITRQHQFKDNTNKTTATSGKFQETHDHLISAEIDSRHVLSLCLCHAKVTVPERSLLGGLRRGGLGVWRSSLQRSERNLNLGVVFRNREWGHLPCEVFPACYVDWLIGPGKMGSTSQRWYITFTWNVEVYFRKNTPCIIQIISNGHFTNIFITSNPLDCLCWWQSLGVSQVDIKIQHICDKNKDVTQKETKLKITSSF